MEVAVERSQEQHICTLLRRHGERIGAHKYGAGSVTEDQVTTCLWQMGGTLFGTLHALHGATFDHELERVARELGAAFGELSDLTVEARRRPVSSQEVGQSGGECATMVPSGGGSEAGRQVIAWLSTTI